MVWLIANNSSSSRILWIIVNSIIKKEIRIKVIIDYIKYRNAYNFLYMSYSYYIFIIQMFLYIV